MDGRNAETPPQGCVFRHTCSCTQVTGCPLGHPFFGPDPDFGEFTEHDNPASTPSVTTTIDITHQTESGQPDEFNEASTIAAPHVQLTTVVVDLE